MPLLLPSADANVPRMVYPPGLPVFLNFPVLFSYYLLSFADFLTCYFPPVHTSPIYLVS